MGLLSLKSSLFIAWLFLFKFNCVVTKQYLFVAEDEDKLDNEYHLESHLSELRTKRDVTNEVNEQMEDNNTPRVTYVSNYIFKKYIIFLMFVV